MALGEIDRPPMINEQPPGVAGGPPGGPGSPEEEAAKRRIPEELKRTGSYSFYEYDPNYLMIERGTPEEVRHAVDMAANYIEFGAVWSEAPPNSYKINNLVEILRSRARATRVTYPLFGNWPSYLYHSEPAAGEGQLITDASGHVGTVKVEGQIKKDEKGNVVADIVPDAIQTDAEKRRAYWESLDKSANLLDARLTIAQDLQTRAAFARDVDTIAVELFQRPGAASFYMNNWKEVFRAPENVEGFGEYNLMIEEGVKALYNVARGQAKIRLPDRKLSDGTIVPGKEKILPNPFGSRSNHGLMEFILKRYVVNRIKTAVPGQMPENIQGTDKEDAWKNAQEFEWYCAAISSLVFWKWGNADTSFSFSLDEWKGKMPQSGSIGPEDIPKLKLITGPLWTSYDWSKLQQEVRRLAEWGKTKMPGVEKDETGEAKALRRRDHLRVAGAPASLGCYPTLFVNFWEACPFETIGVIKDQDGNIVKKDIIKATVWDLLTGSGKVKTFEQKKDSQGKKIDGQYELLEWEIPEMHLKDISTDEIKIFGDDIETPDENDPNNSKMLQGIAKSDYLEFLSGIEADAYHIPYALSLFYATKYFFDLAINNDFPKVNKEIFTTATLFNMNKALDVALGVMGAAKGLPPELINKLNEYVRVTFLGSLFVSLWPDNPNQVKELEKNAYGSAGFSNRLQQIQSFIESAAKRGFFKMTNDQQRYESVDVKVTKLFEYIVADDVRQCPLPGDIPPGIQNLGWFTDQELTMLAESGLYPLGVSVKNPIPTKYQ